ncbi:unnamed protein product, partial [Didymodactylos carnosus]
GWLSPDQSYVLEKYCAQTLRNCRFHQQLRDIFAPLVVRYVDLMEACIVQSIHKGFEKENWKSRTIIRALNISDVYDHGVISGAALAN